MGVILAVTALVFFFMRRRKSQAAQNQQAPADAGAGWKYQPPSEMPTSYTQGLGKQVVELPAGGNMAVELDGSKR